MKTVEILDHCYFWELILFLCLRLLFPLALYSNTYVTHLSHSEFGYIDKHHYDIKILEQG